MNRTYESLILQITTRCNLSCSYCFQRGKGRTEDMAVQTTRNAIEWLLEKKDHETVPKILFYGGEPLVRRDLIEDALCNYSKDIVSFEVITNGTLLTDNLIGLLGRREVRVVLSYDGNTSAQILRGGNISLIPNSILSHIAGELHSTVRITFTKETLHLLPDSIRFLHSLGFTRIGFVPAEQERWAIFDWDVIQRILTQIIEYWIDSIKRRSPIWLKPLGSYVLGLATNSTQFQYYMHPCFALQKSLAVSPGGYFFPCHRHLDIPSERLSHKPFHLDPDILTSTENDLAAHTGICRAAALLYGKGLASENTHFARNMYHYGAREFVRRIGIKKAKYLTQHVSMNDDGTSAIAMLLSMTMEADTE